MTANVAVIGIVAVFGIISVVAGFAAEATRIRESEVYIEHYTFTCVYQSSPAVRLGILAAVFAIITRVVLLIVVGCCRPNIINILSWIASIVAVILFLAGAVLNNRKGAQQKYDGRLTCYVMKPGIFVAGSIFSVFGTFFGIVAYMSVSSSMETVSQIDIELPVPGDVDVKKRRVHPQQN